MHSTRSVDSLQAPAVAVFEGARNVVIRTSKNASSHASSPEAADRRRPARAISDPKESGSSPTPCWIAASYSWARARGMAQVARDTGLSRESLYKALSGERSPDFDTILKVVNALGLRLHAEAALS